MSKIVRLTPSAEQVWKQVVHYYTVSPAERWGWSIPGTVEALVNRFCEQIKQENGPFVTSVGP